MPWKACHFHSGRRRRCAFGARAGRGFARNNRNLSVATAPAYPPHRATTGASRERDFMPLPRHLLTALMRSRSTSRQPPAQPAPPAAVTRESTIIVYGDDPCPQPENENEAVVCARQPEEERYRDPAPDPRAPADRRSRAGRSRASSRERSRTRSLGRCGANSCSAVGSRRPEPAAAQHRHDRGQHRFAERAVATGGAGARAIAD